MARYVHLNPVRVGGLGLGKEEQRQAKVLGCADPGRALVNRRLAWSRHYRWSSWRVYSGAEPPPPWLETGWVGRGRAEQRAALAAYTEAPERQGVLESPWRGLVGGLVLGEEAFARQLLRGRGVNVEEQTAARRRRPRVEWAEVVGMTEGLRKRAWAELLERHGDWGRDGAMYFAVRHGGQRLAEVVRQIPGLRYQAAAQAVKRFGAVLESEAERRRFIAKLKRQLSTI